MSINKEIKDDFKNMVKDNRTLIFIIIGTLVCSLIILSLASWFVKDNPKVVSPHESEEVCNEMGGDYLKYKVMLSGSVAVPIYKCMERVEDESETRREIEEKR